MSNNVVIQFDLIFFLSKQLKYCFQWISADLFYKDEHEYHSRMKFSKLLSFQADKVFFVTFNGKWKIQIILLFSYSTHRFYGWRRRGINMGLHFVTTLPQLNPHTTTPPQPLKPTNPIKLNGASRSVRWTFYKSLLFSIKTYVWKINFSWKFLQWLSKPPALFYFIPLSL